jgi:hypothetical protein
MQRDPWLRLGLALSRDGELVPWVVAVGSLLAVLLVAMVARVWE